MDRLAIIQDEKMVAIMVRFSISRKD